MSGTAKKIGVLAWVCLAALWGGGCDRWGGSLQNEIHEANYIEGNNLRLQGQTNSAIQSFERALHVNPSNVQAHMAIADLFFATQDYTSAAYHYSRCSRLLGERGGKPDRSLLSLIEACELQLAVKYSERLGRQQTDARLDELRQKVVERDDALQKLQLELARLRPGTNPVASQPISPSGTASSAEVPRVNPHPTPSSQPLVADPTPVSKPVTRPTVAPVSTPSATVSSRTSSRSRTVVVRRGDTPAAIARRAGVSTRALLAANPGLNPTRMHPGQVINLPNP